MGIAKIRSSFDVGAPVLSETVGSLIPIFDAVLVTGYGSQTSLGWTKEFTGTNKAVYRSSGASTNLFYRFDDTLNVDGNAGFIRCVVTVYESMSDIDNGSGLCGTFSITHGDAYVFIGDSSRFWFFNRKIADYTACPNTGFWVSNFIGQGLRINSNYPNFVCGYGFESISGSWGTRYGNRCGNYSFSKTDAISSTFLHRKVSGELAGNIHFSSLPFTTQDQAWGVGAYTTFSLSEIYLARPFIIQTGSKILLGYLPGMHTLEHEPDAVRDALYVDTASGFSIVTIDSKSYYAFRIMYNWPSYSIPGSTYILINPNEDFL